MQGGDFDTHCSGARSLTPFMGPLSGEVDAVHSGGVAAAAFGDAAQGKDDRRLAVWHGVLLWS